MTVSGGSQEDLVRSELQEGVLPPRSVQIEEAITPERIGESANLGLIIREQSQAALADAGRDMRQTRLRRSFSGLQHITQSAI